MRKIINIDGGIGRVLCATGPIARLFDKTRDEIVVVTPWPEVFWYNPSIYKIYRPDTEYLWDDVIKHGEYIPLEPYYDHLYYTQQVHLSGSINNTLNQERTQIYPLIYLGDDERQWAYNVISEIKKHNGNKPIVAFQPFGSTFTMDQSGGFDRSHRSLNMMQVGYLLQEIGDSAVMVNCSHVELPFNNAWNVPMNTRQMFALVAACDFIVAVDSCVTHIGAAFNKKGVAIYGSTYSENIGYNDFLTCYRDGYPKAYVPNRLPGGLDYNAGGMDYSTYELHRLAVIIRDQSFVNPVVLPESQPEIAAIEELDQTLSDQSPQIEE